MIWFSLAKLSPENNFFLNTSFDFKRILVFAFGPLPCVVEEVLTNTLAACVNVLFIHKKNITGLVRKNIALLPFLTFGGMSTANTQNFLFNPNNTELYRQYAHAERLLLG
jgi:hypothetical protein